MNTSPLASTRLSVRLPAGLHARLVRYAAREGIGLSQAARRALDAGLPVLERGSLPDPTAALEALEVLRRIREEVRARYGVLQGDLVNQVREERERQMDQVLWPEKQANAEDEA
jgi:hypothetical protein